MMRLLNKLAFDRGELLCPKHSPRALRERRAITFDGPIGRLNRWVDDVRAETGEQIPYFDPAAARLGTQVLMLFQDPSEVAETGSGFISRHNNDQTARNAYLAADAAGLSYDICLHWNVIPWWVDNPAKPRRTLSAEAVRARPYLKAVLELLEPAPSVIIVSGGAARHAWKALTRAGNLPQLHGARVLHCPHPSPLSYPKVDKTTGRLNSELILETFTEALPAARSSARAATTRPEASSGRSPAPR
jgi:uracil-DNA glycosylase